VDHDATYEFVHKNQSKACMQGGSLMKSDRLVLSTFSNFVEYLKIRMQLEFFLDQSQESLIRFLFGTAIITTRKDYLNSLYIDYPVGKQVGARDKIDIFLASNNGYYFEVKFMRPIPSRATRPLPQHRGALINDVIKLIKLTPHESHRFLLLVADDEFIRHVEKKPGFPLTGSWYGQIEDLIVAETERRQIKFPNSYNLNVEMAVVSEDEVNELIIVLWDIKCPRAHISDKST